MRGSRVLHPGEVFMEKQREQSVLRARWLFENHIEFLSTHRGKVARLPDSFTIESDRPEFTYAVLGQGGDRTLLNRFNSIHLIPWSDPWDQKLKDPRFQARGGLSYMTFDGTTDPWKRNPAVEIRRVADEREMDVFSHVQAAGFAQKQEDYERWYPWLRSANHRNLRNGEQAFYVGYLDGKAVGTPLLVMTKGLGGIYAVATLPEYRKQGVGTSLMAQAIADARSRGDDLITLQVAEGSYAESLYEKLGFMKQFCAKIYSR